MLISWMTVPHLNLILVFRGQQKTPTEFNLSRVFATNLLAIFLGVPNP